MSEVATHRSLLAGRAYDAVVIGAGPAGAMAARELALGGADVLLVEKREFPRSKVCGACLNGHALGVLDEAGLGSLVRTLGGMPLSHFEVRLRGRSTRIAMPGGFAVSRSRFDLALATAAMEAGATFVQGVEASVRMVNDGGRTVWLRNKGEPVLVRAKVVVVAAGLGNRCLTNAETPATRVMARSRVGAGCSIEPGELVASHYTADTIYMAMGRRGYVGMVRLEDDSLNVAAAFEPAAVRAAGGPGAVAAAVLAEAGFPSIEALKGVQWQGTPTLTRRTRPPGGERLFLIGDAAGYVEPFTGEGMAWGLASGHRVARLVLAGIERWDERLTGDWTMLHHRTIGRRQGVCRMVAFASRRLWLARAALAMAARAPGTVERLMRALNAPPSQLEMS